MRVFSGVVSLDPLDPAYPAWPATNLGGLDTRSADGRWLIGWSGRLDNLDEVRRQFHLDSSVTDRQMVADLLARGGIVALGALIGDFATVAWDAVERRLWLARDAIGFRPLFYVEAGDRIWFSTEQRVLSRGPARDHAINAGYLAEALAGLVVTIEETPIDGVRRVLPAEALGFSAGRRGPQRLALWQPPTRMPARRRDADLVDEFRARFTAAVTASLGRDGRVATQLSGGLDSTAVSSVAGAIVGAPLDAYSIVYPSQPLAPDGALLDETPFIEMAVAATGARSVRVAPLDPRDPDRLSRASLLRVLTVHGDLPDLPVTDALVSPLLTRAAADGHTAMLTGLGGDYWLTGSLSRFPALLGRGRLVAAWRFAHAAADVDTLEATPAQLGAHVLSRLSPDWLRALRRRLWPARRWPAWIPAAFARDVSLSRRLQRLSARVPRVGDAVLADSLLRLYLAEGLLVRESLFRAAADAGIEIRHPMLDRRFVEFVLTLPDDLRMRDGETRYILRRALSSSLPPAIRDRRSTGAASMLTAIAIATVMQGRTFAGGRAAARGWIDPAPLDAYVRHLAVGDRARAMAAADELGEFVWPAVAVEMWLSERGA